MSEGGGKDSKASVRRMEGEPGGWAKGLEGRCGMGLGPIMVPPSAGSAGGGAVHGGTYRGSFAAFIPGPAEAPLTTTNGAEGVGSSTGSTCSTGSTYVVAFIPGLVAAPLPAARRQSS